MVSRRTVTDAGRALAFLLLYGLVASALAPRLDPYFRVLGTLLVSVAVFAVVDVLPALVRSERPLIAANSRLYSVRGLILLILLILVTAVTADWLRRATDLSDVVVTVTGFVAGVAVVLGPVAGYYWRRSGGATPTT